MNTKSVTDYLQSLRDIEAAIQLGILPETIGTIYHKFAGRLNIDTTQSIISTCYNENPFNTTNQQLYLSSADATANQTIFLEGIDQNYQVRQLNIQLQGQTAIPLSVNFRTVWRGYNSSSTDLLGDVYVGTEANPTGGIPAVDNQYANIVSIINGKLVNQTLTSIFTIPTNYTGFVTRWYVTADKGADIDFTAYVREENKVFRYVERMQIFESSYAKELPYMRIPEKTDMKVMGATSVAQGNGSVTYDLILINNDFLNKMRRLNWR